MVASRHQATPPLRRFHSDVAAGAVTLALGIALSIAASGVKPSSFGNSILQPRDLPFACGVGLIIAGVVLTIQGILKMRPGAAAAPGAVASAPEAPAAGSEEGAAPPVKVDETASKDSPRNLLVLGSLLLVYALTFIPLGYMVATVIFLFAGTMYFSPNKWRRNATFAVLFSVCVYFAFTEVFGIALPKGILEFLL